MNNSSTHCWATLEHCYCDSVYSLTVLSTLGNVFTTVVIATSKKLRHRSTFIFILFLALADMSAMLQMTSFCALYTPFFRENKNTVSKCVFKNLQNWMNAGTVSLSYALILLVTIERFAVVYFPFHGQRIFIRRNAVILSAVAIIVSFLSTIYLFWMFKPEGGKCREVSSVYTVADKSQVIAALITWVVLLMLCIAIIYKLRRVSKGHQKLSTCNLSGRYRNTHILLLSNVIAFLLLVGPVRIVDFLNGVTAQNTYTIPLYLREILWLLSKLNHCVNVVLYAVSCRDFRNAIVRMKRRCLRKLVTHDDIQSESRVENQALQQFHNVN